MEGEKKSCPVSSKTTDNISRCAPQVFERVIKRISNGSETTFKFGLKSIGWRIEIGFVLG